MFTNQATKIDYDTSSITPVDQFADAHCPDAIDFEHLGRYTMGSHELEHEILMLFSTQCEDYIASLKNALEDAEAWKQVTHAIKGSARGVGAWRIAAETQAAELMVGDALYIDRVSAIHSISFAVDEVVKFVKLKYS